MEFQRAYKIFQPSHLGEEKQQMLNLNRRLETYLSRVKLLEEENELLANEIKALRHNNQGALAQRRGLEEQLQQARVEVDAAWRERVLTELEVEKMNEELQELELQRQMEAQAKQIAKSKLEQSRKEMQEEERAQMWLREKVNQMEYEMRLLVQTHEEDVAHLEATMIQSRATMPPTQAQRANQAPDLLRMGQEFSQSATRAWQEAAGAFRGQLAWLEESLEQARSRLNQVHQEKQDSQLKLQTLEKEIASAQDVRLHLEKTVSQHREEHCQEIQHLQEHLQDLEMEKEKLAQQIAHLLQENRSLMQMKMSLGLEVTTYRALLDGEGLGADVASSHKPRYISIRGNQNAVLRPHGVKKNYQTQLSASFKTTLPSSVLSNNRSTGTGAQTRSAKPATLNKTPKFSSQLAETDTIKSVTYCYPQSVQFETAENFTSHEVHEKVTDTTPLSSAEQEAPPDVLEGNKEEQRNIVDVEAVEEQIVTESVVSQKFEPGLRNKPPFADKAALCHFTKPRLTLCSFQEGEDFDRVSDEMEQVALGEGSEKEDVLQPWVQDSASMKIQPVDKEAEHIQEETSDSETEAMLEPTIESRPSSPDSECESIETVFNQATDPSIDTNISNDHCVMIKQELNSALVGRNEKEVEDKLYPDGEEMDTWDSVIERKVNVTEDEVKNEGKKQHAEPEEDISAKEPEEVNREAFQTDSKTSSVLLTQAGEGQDTLDQEHPSSPDKEEENDDEDSQNVSVSWRTELESDSYAQENTLADTRPLIRYKSDDTDANTQVSHIDESESSDGEQEKKMDEAGMGTWSDSKSKTFGTMEDLCEDVEEETIDEDYNLRYTHVEGRDASQSTIGEHVTVVTDGENTEEMVKNVCEEHLEKETKGLMGAAVHTDVDSNEELATEKLMEQEIEDLSTDRSSVHFAEEQLREEILQMDEKSVVEVVEQAEHKKAKPDSLSSCEPEMSENHKHVLSTLDQTLENQMFSDPYSAMYLSNTTAVEEVQHRDQQTRDKPEREEEEGEHNIHTLHDAKATEDQSDLNDFISRPEMDDMEETKEPEGPDSVVEADQNNLNVIPAWPEVTEAPPEETPKDGQEHVIEDDEDFHKIPADTAKCEVLENQMFSDPYTAMYPSNTTAEEEVQHRDQHIIDKPEREEEEGEHNVHMMHDPDATEDQSEFTDYINKPETEDMEDTKHLKGPDSVVLVETDQTNPHDIPASPEVTEALTKETPKDDQEHVIEDNEDFHKIPAETAEQEVLENPAQVLEVRDQKEPYQNENKAELMADDLLIHQELVRRSSDSVPSQNDIFIMKDVTDSSLHHLFASDVKKDFWVSSLESGASYKPDDACNEAAEQTNQNQEFTHNQMWANLENPNVVNGNSRSDVDSSKAKGAVKEQEQVHVEVKKVVVHSEESEVDAESWSSGEEPI